MFDRTPEQQEKIDKALAACWEQINAGGCDRQARIDASIDHRLERHYRKLSGITGYKGKAEIDEEKARESMGYGTGRRQSD